MVNDVQRQRRTSLKTLSMSLITETIESRVVKLGKKKFKHIKSDVQESYKRSLYLDDLSDFKTPPKKTRKNQSPKTKRCEYCHHVPQSKLSALKKCQDCKKFCCKNHSTVYTTIICNTCKYQWLCYILFIFLFDIF